MYCEYYGCIVSTMDLFEFYGCIVNTTDLL